MQGLEIKNLSKSYGNVKAISGLNLTVKPGEIVGFLGPNGAGKSTTMRSVLGVVSPDAGQVLWNGAQVDDKFPNSVGYMPQERGLYPRMKVKEQIIYFARLSGLSKMVAAKEADIWLEKLELQDRADSHVQELSGGNQQRVQLIVALVHKPMLMVLDEPFAGLDPIAAQVMRDIIKDQVDSGVAVLFSSHQLSLVSDLCDRVAIVVDGSVVASGTTAELRDSSGVRNLKVVWSDDRADTWHPDGKLKLNDLRRLEIEVSSDLSLNEVVDSLSSQGEIANLTFEPPTLDEVFSEMVVG